MIKYTAKKSAGYFRAIKKILNEVFVITQSRKLPFCVLNDVLNSTLGHV